MTDPYELRPDDSPIDPNTDYTGPPSTGQYFPASQSGPYPPPSAPMPPPPGYPGSYPPPWDSGRPGGVLAAGVLAYIDAGLLILAGLLLLVGASAVDSWNNAFGTNDNSFTAELATDGIINLVSAGLQIAGAVMITGRNERGRVVLTVGGGLCIAAGIYWALRVHEAGIVFWTALFVALPIIGLSMVWSAPATMWLRGENPRQGAPPSH